MNTSNYFSKKVVKTLASMGIKIVGVQMLPDMTSSLPYANAQTGFVVDDNGTGRVKTFTEVLALAA